MEWTGGQQLGLLMESGGLGLLLGLLFDVNSGLSRATPGRRAARFLRDMLFGLLAALVTFFVSLAVMDGRLHPLLFCGSALGFWLEHISVGRWVARLTCRVRHAWRRISQWLLATTESFIVGFSRKIGGFFYREKRPKLSSTEENTENIEKIEKNSLFFEKTLEI